MSAPRQASRPEQGSGVLILVVGPSGAGKDTLIEAARRHFAGDPRFSFPERIITRTDQAGEAHIAVSPQEFSDLEAKAAFFLSWSAHDTSYGVPAEIVSDLDVGKLVVVNVSRGVIEAARKKWPNVRVVNVWAPPSVLRERLITRGREGGDAIGERLESRGSLADDVSVDEIENSDDRETAIARFNKLLEAYAREARAGVEARRASRRS